MKSFGVFAVIVALCVLVMCLSAVAQGNGVRISLVPGADYYLWDDYMGLKDNTLYGGRLSADLGRFVSLQGYYLMNDAVKTDLTEVAFENWTDPIVDQKIGLRNYGADLVFNLGHGPVVPFIRGGGGIFRFEPKEGEVFEQIAAKVGFGTRFAIDPRVRMQIHVEDVMMHLDRTRFLGLSEAPETPPVDPEKAGMRHNISVGVGLNFQLNGAPSAEETELDRAIRQRYSKGLFGASWPIEPFAGRLNFDKSAGLDDQPFLGIRTGVNLGDLLGVRGYYWRGMDDNFTGTEPIQSWGGEAQFNLTSGQGFVPYVLFGVGKIDFKNDYLDLDSLERSDQGLLILGGGVSLTLSQNLRIELSARDNIFSETDLKDISEPAELLHNWSFSGGLNFLVGKKSNPAEKYVPLGQQPVAQVVPAVVVQPVPLAGEAPAQQPVPGAVMVQPAPAPAAVQVVSLGVPGAPVSYQGDRTVTIPVPTVGEIYIRYGEPGGVTIASQGGAPGPGAPAVPGAVGSSAALDESIRRAVREEMAAMGLGRTEAQAAPEVTGAEGAPVGEMSDAERMDLLTRRLEDKLTAVLDERFAEQRDVIRSEAPREVPSQTVVVEPATAAPTVSGRNVVYPYVGVNLDYPEQFVVGGRLDIGPVRPGSKIRVLPEVAIGFFTKGSFMFAVNTQYNFGSVESKGRIGLYVFGGLGVIHFGKGVDRDRTEAVLNLGYGVTRNFGKWVVFAEHQGIDIFNMNRLNFGIRYPL
jgi:hypothetical protein